MKWFIFHLVIHRKDEEKCSILEQFSAVIGLEWMSRSDRIYTINNRTGIKISMFCLFYSAVTVYIKAPCAGEPIGLITRTFFINYQKENLLFVLSLLYIKSSSTSLSFLFFCWVIYDKWIIKLILLERNFCMKRCSFLDPSLR